MQNNEEVEVKEQIKNDLNNEEDKQSKYLIIRILFIILGVLSFALGTIGIFLPILPTTPLYLLTTYCFARGSKRFNDWFIATKLYKKYVAGFVEHRAMTVVGMMMLLACVSAMLILAMCMVPNILPMTITLIVLIVIKYAYFITRVKVVSKEELIEMKSKSKEIEVCNQDI